MIALSILSGQPGFKCPPSIENITLLQSQADTKAETLFLPYFFLKILFFIMMCFFPPVSNLAAMKVFKYDVASSPISVHLPVSRFLAGKNIRCVRRAVFKLF